MMGGTTRLWASTSTAAGAHASLSHRKPGWVGNGGYSYTSPRHTSRGIGAAAGVARGMALVAGL